MDTLKKRIQKYWRSRSRDFSLLREAELESSMADLWGEELKSALPGKMGMRILDVGTGSGFFAILLSLMGHQVTGIDFSAEMIEEARKLAWKEKAGPSFFVMDGEQPDFPDDSFDVVLSRNLTWTLEQPEEAYRQWLRVLKPGGLLANYDGNYGKVTYSRMQGQLPKEHVHNHIAPDLLKECDAISSHLPLSKVERPSWDVEILKDLGACKINFDMEVSKRIYQEVNPFYNPEAMFRVTAIKYGEGMR